MESFFSSLKIKRTARKAYRTREGARLECFTPQEYANYFANAGYASKQNRHVLGGQLAPLCEHRPNIV
jgi:hypothetical protein